MADSDDSLKSYLTAIKGTAASQEAYELTLQGNITGWKKISSAIAQYNALSSSGAEEQKKLAAAVSASNSGLGAYLSGLNGAEATLGGYVLSLTGATIKTFALNAATTALNAALSMGASFLISGVVSAISAWINHAEIMAEKAEKARTKIQSLSRELKDNQNFISDNARRYAELAQGVDQLTGQNISLTHDDYEEFLSLSNQLAELFPSLTRNYNDNGDAIVQLSGDVDTIVGSLHHLMEAQRALTNKQIADELPTIFSDLMKKSNQYESKIEELKRRRNTLLQGSENFTRDNFRQEILTNLENRSFEFVSHDAEEHYQMLDDYSKLLQAANLSFRQETLQEPTWTGELDASGVPIYEYRTALCIDSSEEEIASAKETIDNCINELADQYAKDLNQLNNEINLINQQNKANWSSLSGSIFAWLSTEDSFKIMDDSTQAIVQNIINNFDWGSLDFSSWKQAKGYIQEHILSLFNTSEGRKVLSDIQIMLDTQARFHNGDMSIDDYQQKLQHFLSKIDHLSSEQQRSIMFLFGLQTDENGTLSSDIDILVNNVQNKLQDEFDENVGKLTLDELQIAAEQIEVSENDLLSWDELIAKVKEYQASLKDSDSLSISQTVDLLNAGFKPAFDSLQSVYQSIFTDNEFIPENVDLSLLTSLKSSLDDLNAVDGIQIDYSSFEDLAQTLTDTSTTTEDARQAVNAFATDLVSSLSPSLSQCDGESYQFVQRLLESMGIVNAEDVMISTLGYSYEEYAAAKQEAADAGLDLVNATQQEIQDFLFEEDGIVKCSEALALFELKKRLANGTNLNTAEDIQQIYNLASVANIGKDVLHKLANANNILNLVEQGTAVSLSMYEKALQDAEEAKEALLDWEPTPIEYDGSSKSKSSPAAQSAARESDILSELNSQMDQYQSNLKALQETKESYDQYGKISVDQAQDILDADFKLLAAYGEEQTALENLGHTKLNEMQIQLARNAIDTVNRIRSEADATQYLAGANEHLTGTSLDATESLLQQAVAAAKLRGTLQGQAADTILQGYVNGAKMLGQVDFSFDASSVQDASETFSKSFNWIENLLDKLSDITERWTSAADQFYGWWNKNKAVNQAIRATQAEQSTRSDAYAYYMAKADAVGLPAKYRDLLANGSLSLETVKNEALADKIEQYQEWIEKAKECKTAVSKLYEQERELIRQKLDNILDYYDSLDRYYKSLASKFDSVLDLKEAKGQRQTIGDLMTQFEQAMNQSDLAREKADAYQYEYNTSEEADHYRKQLAQMDSSLKATAQYQRLLEDIAALEAKQTKQTLAGKTLNSADTQKLQQYYALRQALEQNATAETIANYTEVYNKWYKLQQQIDNGKNLTTTQRKNYNDYSEQLKAYADSKARQKSLLHQQTQEALSKLSGEDPKAERLKLAQSAADDLTAAYEAQTAAIQQKLEATSQYRTLVENIAKLESKNGSLTAKQQKQLQDYYAKKKALDESATAATVKNYSTIYDKWKSLQDKLDAGKTLTKAQQAKYESYQAQLDAYRTEKTGALTAAKAQLDQDIAAVFAKADTIPTQAAATDAYEKTAQELKANYERQAGEADEKLKATETYKKLTAQIDNTQAQLDKLYAVDEGKRTKSQNSQIKTLTQKLGALQRQKEALDQGATADNLTEYLKAYEKWIKLQDKLDSGKSLTKSESQNYDRLKAQLETWVNAKQDAIRSLHDELQDSLAKLESEKQTQIAENESALAESQAKVYELAKQIAEFNITNLEAEMDALDALINSAKSYISLYTSMSRDNLVLAGVIDPEDDRSLEDIMAQRYQDAIDSTDAKYQKLLEQQQEYEDLISAAAANDWNTLFEKYQGDAETETIRQLKAILQDNDYDSNAWVAQWQASLSEVNQELLDCIQSNQELLDGLRENVYLNGVNQAVTQIGYLQNQLSSLIGLIDEDWLYDADGGLTSYGTAKVSLLVEQMEQAKEAVNRYASAMDTVERMKDTYASDKAYQEALADAKQNYLSSLTDLKGYQDSIVSILRKTDESVVQSLQTVINKRKEALQKQKDLYDYGRSLQSSQKEVDSLKAQIAALESLSGAMDTAAKAKLSQLKADLAEKEENLQATKNDHTYQLQIEALDTFQETLSSTMTDAADSVNASFETYASALRSAMDIYQQNKEYLSEWSDTIIQTTLGIGNGMTAIAQNTGTAEPSDTEARTALENGIILQAPDSLLYSAAGHSLPNSALDGISYGIPDILSQQLAGSPVVSGFSTMPPVINIHYDNLLYVEGSVDKEFARVFPDYLEQACEYTKRSLYQEMSLLR